jgi:hypothetical protein
MNKSYEERVMDWMESAFNAINDAHGNPKTILEKLPKDLKETLIRNDIHFVYKGKSMK